MNIKPLGNRILVKRNKTEEITAGGVLLVDSAQTKAMEGEVLALSDSYYGKAGQKKEFKVSVGDRVTFTSWGSELEYEQGDQTFAFINEDSIVGVLK